MQSVRFMAASLASEWVLYLTAGQRSTSCSAALSYRQLHGETESGFGARRL